MPRKAVKKQRLHKVILLSLLLLLLQTTVCVAEVTQREWLEQLVDSLGWGYGLPDNPETEDYLALLSGQRKLLIEAEDHHRQSDRVARKRQTNFGQFSGSGWLSGRREPVSLHLDILIPHSGRYRVAAATRGAGVQLQIAAQQFVASAGKQLTTQELGFVELEAGLLEIKVQLPPEGGIDFLHLEAEPLGEIAPLGGWQPDRQLTIADLSLTLLQTLKLLELLPATDNVVVVEAESAQMSAGAQVSDDRHLGAPSGGRWVRAGNQQTDWQLPVRVQQPGCYQLRLIGSGSAPVAVGSGLFARRLEFGSALNTVELGRFCLPQGDFSLAMQLSPRSGIDRLEMHRLATDDQTLRQLLGVSAEQQFVTQQTLNDLLQLFANLIR
jgi:hypothetical protein